MSINIYVVDTSYLIELSGCGRDSNPEACRRVRELFDKVGRSGGRFFVPLPCLFELGDHIADVRHSGERSRLAAWLLQTVNGSLTDRTPWQITPTGKPEEILPMLLERFQGLAVDRMLGMVDSFIVQEAERLKGNFRGYKARVHIWTNDRPPKGL